jgi:hypothetical protein
MAYFPDLSAYSYDLTAPLTGVQNAGWLDARHEFPRGDVDAALIAKLAFLVVHKTVQQMRGFHYCEFCDQEDVWVRHGGAATLLGTAEIWIPASDHGTCFASPNLIVHYVEQHRYRPPDSYLDGLRALDVDSWDPEPIVEAALRAARAGAPG